MTKFATWTALIAMLILNNFLQADPLVITGTLVNQHPTTPVVHPDIWNSGTWTSQWFSPGSLVQYPDGTLDLLTSVGWTYVPPEVSWLTQEGSFTGRLTDSVLLINNAGHTLSWNLAEPPIYPDVLVVTPESLMAKIDGQQLVLDYQGYKLAEGTWQADPLSVSEGPLLFQLGLALLIVSRLGVKKT